MLWGCVLRDGDDLLSISESASIDSFVYTVVDTAFYAVVDAAFYTRQVECVSISAASTANATPTMFERFSNLACLCLASGFSAH